MNGGGDDIVFPQEPTQQSADQIDLPPLPEEPTRPTLPNLDQITDNEARKVAEKEAKRAQKSYDKAVKARDKAIQEREKTVQKRRKAARKEAKWQEGTRKAQQRRQYEADEATICVDKAGASADKPRKKNVKFCTLPRKSNGVRDSTWIDVHMDGVDEVGAHCGLFMPGAHYDGLVGDVASRIAGWVFEDMSKRAILEGVK